MKPQTKHRYISTTERKYIAAIASVDELITLYSQALIDARSVISPSEQVRGTIVIEELEEARGILVKHRKLVVQAARNAPKEISTAA